MAFGLANTRDDSFADSRDDSLLCCASDKSLDVGTDGYPGLAPQLDSIGRDGINRRFA